MAERTGDLPAEVLEGARRGDPVAVEALYRRYAPAVLAFHRARVNDQHLAEDLTSDAFVAVLRALPRYQGGPESFAGWLFSLVRRDLVDHLRRTGRRRESPVDDVAVVPGVDRYAAPDIADAVSDRVDARVLHDALAQLSVDQREVVVLRVVAGLSAAEIATATGRTVGAVKSLQHRGLDSLARLLGRRPGPYPRKGSRRL